MIKDNRSEIKNILGVDDAAIDMLAFEVSRLKSTSRIGKYPFFFHAMLALITNMLYPLLGLKRKIRVVDDDFIFISCPDPVFRTKTIDLIARDLKYSIIHLPNFHILSTVKYNKYFKKKDIHVFFPTIKLRHVFMAFNKINKLNSIIKKDKEGGEKAWSVLSSYAIYDQVVKEYIKKSLSFKGKWLLEHDKFYFMASVINLHQQGEKCTMLQHGIFFRPSSNYFPLFCDNVLCCSEREKRIYMENGIDEKRIIVLGAPLQTLNLFETTAKVFKHYDLLLMMPQINMENKELVKKIISYIKVNEWRVLVRMRPRSRKADEACLAEELHSMTLSKVGTSIENDILSCDKVVSFSEDANVEIVKLNKPFIYIWTVGERDLKSMGNCATEDNFTDEINKLMTRKFYSSFSKDQYIEILGETNLEILRERFEKYIHN